MVYSHDHFASTVGQFQKTAVGRGGALGVCSRVAGSVGGSNGLLSLAFRAGDGGAGAIPEGWRPRHARGRSQRRVTGGPQRGGPARARMADAVRIGAVAVGIAAGQGIESFLPCRVVLEVLVVDVVVVAGLGKKQTKQTWP